MRILVTEYEKTIEINRPAAEVVKRLSQHVHRPKWHTNVWPVDYQKPYQGTVTETTLKIITRDKSEVEGKIFNQADRSTIKIKIKPMPSDKYSNSTFNTVVGVSAAWLMGLCWLIMNSNVKDQVLFIFSLIYFMFAAYFVWLYNKHYEKSAQQNADKIATELASKISGDDVPVLKQSSVPVVDTRELLRKTIIAGSIAFLIFSAFLILSLFLNIRWLVDFTFRVFPFGPLFAGMVIYLLAFALWYRRQKKLSHE